MQILQPDHVRPFKVLSDQIWLYYSMIGFIPLFMLSFYKLRNPIKSSQITNKKHKEDFYCRLLMFYAWIYYIIDCSFTLITNRLHNAQRVAMFIHHLYGIVFIPPVLSLPYLPWYVVIFPALHGLLLTYPDSPITETPYVISIFAIHFGLNQTPYSKISAYKRVERSIYLLYIVAAMLGYFQISNQLPDLSF